MYYTFLFQTKLRPTETYTLRFSMRAFLHMAVYAGLDAAIIDPLDKDMLAAVRTAEALVGRDRHCRRYSRAFRKS